MQQAFIEHDGFQCGYCTSGQIMSATAMIDEPWGAADDDVREAMSGNICRCGAYPDIVAAIQDVRRIAEGGAMIDFDYIDAADLDGAVRDGASAATKFIAGGTTLVDLMKLGVEHPSRIVDLTRFGGAATHSRPSPISRTADCDSARSRDMSDVAWHARVKERYPLVSQALLLARVRPDPQHGDDWPGTFCSARAARTSAIRRPRATNVSRAPGARRSVESTGPHAILGTSDRCIATHPSDLAVAFAALDATVQRARHERRARCSVRRSAHAARRASRTRDDAPAG